jgi:hypothetical protein
MLVSKQKLAMAAGTLPTISSTFRLAAADHPASTAIATRTAASDVIDDNSVAHVKMCYARSNLFNDATWLMPGNHSLVGFGSCPLLSWSIDRTQVAAAKRRGFHADQHLAMSRLWNGKCA